MKVGDKVVDSEGYGGIVTNADDPHNIEVEYTPWGEISSGIGLYCIVPDCEDYDPLYVYGKKELT